MARPLQEINAGSMADIAFLLLIFFLVATTFSTNSGLQRRLPPPSEKETEINPTVVKERNVMVVLVNRENKIAIKGKLIALQDIYKKTKEFFLNSNNNPELPEKDIKDIPLFGKYPVSKGIISLQTDRNTNYNVYLKVQNELVRAINDLRNELSIQKFSKPFIDLTEEQQDAVGKIYPIAISEAEPRKMLNPENQ
jgi:biopolymer transport protein ExbD